MMGAVKFASFEALKATAPDDPIWQKWKGLNLASPLPPQKIDNPTSLATLNVSINRSIRYIEEPRGMDVWQSPGDTWRTKTGDCEDIAILKYAILKNSGIPEVAMWMVVGEIASLNGNKPHAWLAVSFGEWQVMDIMFDHLIRPAQYINWKPVYAVHANEMVHYGKAFRISDVLRDQGA